MTQTVTAADHRAAVHSDAQRGFATGGDRFVMLLAVLLGLVGAFLGAGVLEGLTPTSEAARGWLGADATWLAPATPAFRIWTVIYAGLLAYGLWQLLPGAQSRRHDRLRPWIIASLLLNVAWLLAVQLDMLAVSVVVIVLLLAVLCRILVLLESARPRGLGERILLDGVFGLYLGWVSIATVANVAGWLASTGWSGNPFMPTTWAQIMIVVAVLIGALTSVYDGGRFAPAFALAWGLFWIGVGRSDGTGLLSGAVAVTAWGAAAIVLLSWLAALALSRKSKTGEARDLVLDALDGGDDPVDGVR